MNEETREHHITPHQFREGTLKHHSRTMLAHLQDSIYRPETRLMIVATIPALAHILVNTHDLLLPQIVVLRNPIIRIRRAIALALLFDMSPDLALAKVATVVVTPHVLALAPGIVIVIITLLLPCIRHKLRQRCIGALPPLCLRGIGMSSLLSPSISLLSPTG